MRDILEQPRSNEKPITNYDRDVNGAERARNNQHRDTDPRIEKEGFLGMDDLDRLRRRKISKIF